MEYIAENNLISFLANEGKDYLDSCRETGHFAVAAGKKLYYEWYRSREAADAARGILVICHGYTETCSKYHEMIYYLLKEGYHVFAYDHRGHGRSFREVENPSKVHVDDFDRDYVGDLKLLTDKVIRKAFPALPLFLYGHSMGGCIALRFIELYPDVFSRCILSSPMLGIKTGGIPAPLARALACFMKRLGQGEHYLIGQHDYLPDETFERSSSTNRTRFDRYNEIRKSTPAFQTNAGDYSWFFTSVRAAANSISAKETAKIRIPVLLFAAEDDSYVPRKNVLKLRANLPSVEYHTYTGTKHEIFNSSDDIVQAYFNEISRFLNPIQEC